MSSAHGAPSYRVRHHESHAENGHAGLVSERTPLLSSVVPGRIENPQEQETTVIAEQVTKTKLILIIGTSYLGVFLGSMDSTVVATLSAPISSEFQSLSLFSWLATAYLISNAAFQPLCGRLTDIFGRGPGLVLSNIIFAAGNLICGLAQDEYTMIGGRVVAGIGGGGLMAISTFIASDLIPLRQRGLVQGVTNICYGSGAMLGGIFGGLIQDHTKLGWRLAFLILVPPSLLSAVATAYLVRIPPKQSDKSYLARIDFLGALLVISFLVLLLLGLNSGGNIVPWVSPLPIITISSSLLVLVLMIWWESRAPQPILPVKLFLNRTPVAACACNLFCTMAVMCGLFYAPMYLQTLGESATSAGMAILPSPIGVSMGSLGAGWWMKKTGRYYLIGVAFMGIMVTGFSVFNLLGKESPRWLIGIAFFFIGAGYGAHLTITLLACISSVDHSQQAVITSATYLARSLGGTIGITIGSAVYQNVLKSQLWQRFGDEPNAGHIINRIRDDLDALKHLPTGWYDGVMDSFMAAFSTVWVTLLVMSVLGLICIACLKQHVLHSTLER